MAGASGPGNRLGSGGYLQQTDPPVLMESKQFATFDVEDFFSSFKLSKIIEAWLVYVNKRTFGMHARASATDELVHTVGPLKRLF